jgi:hypothetical protein
MKTIISCILIILFVSSSVLYSQTKGSSSFYSVGHDSLSIDGSNGSPYTKASFTTECFWKVVKIKGSATGRVLKPEISNTCTREYETLYVAKDMTLAENDYLEEGSVIETGPNGMVAVSVFLAGDKHLGSFTLTAGPSSKMRIFTLSELCSAIKAKREYYDKDRVTIIKGKVTYDSEPGSLLKVRTQGQNSSVVHTQTLYTTEVMINGNDTADVIRVFKGSVEVTFERPDVKEDELMTKEVEKVTKDMQEGKMTNEEFMAKMLEIQAYGQRKSDLSVPTIVNEGSKCTVTLTSKKVEPLGSDDNDRWWEK